MNEGGASLDGPRSNPLDVPRKPVSVTGPAADHAAPGPSTAAVAVAGRLGVHAGDVVGEVGYDDDVDEELRQAVESTTGTDLLGDDADEVLDAVLLWWREGDGDLTDVLVDALTLLADDAGICLLTPRTGRSGYVEPSEVAEATRTAGLAQTTSAPAGSGWMATRLARSRPGRVRR